MVRRQVSESARRLVQSIRRRDRELDLRQVLAELAAVRMGVNGIGPDENRRADVSRAQRGEKLVHRLGVTPGNGGREIDGRAVVAERFVDGVGQGLRGDVVAARHDEGLASGLLELGGEPVDSVGCQVGRLPSGRFHTQTSRERRERGRHVRRGDREPDVGTGSCERQVRLDSGSDGTCHRGAPDPAARPSRG